MEIKIKRVFNIFNPRVYPYLILIDAFWLYSFVSSLYESESSVEWFVVQPFYFMVLNLGFVWIFTLSYPRSFSICDGTIKWSERKTLFSRHWYGHSRRWVKVDYYVFDVKKIEANQNPIERFFNVGRITFSGRVEFDAGYDTDRIKIKDKYTLYGVKKFSEFKKEYCDK